MICRKCGKKIKDDRLYCPECGAEQIPSEYSGIEDELKESMNMLKQDMKESDSDMRFNTSRIMGTESLKIPIQPAKKSVSKSMGDTKRELYRKEKAAELPEEEEFSDDEDWEEEEFHLDKRDTAAQKRVKLIISIVALSVAILVIIAAIIIVIAASSNRNSYETLTAEGKEAWKAGRYEAAIASFENAVEKAGDNNEKSEVLSTLAGVYVDYGDENSAIYYYEAADEAGRLSNEDLGTLVNLYENKADLNAIRRLAETYSNEENESLFARHLLNQPVFSYKSGTYNELLTVEITAADNEQIFYTLDNKEATPQSTPYTGPLQIGEGTTVVRAVALNANGLLSDEIITTYEVHLDVPLAPVITPETGSYSDTNKVTIHNIPTNCRAYYTIDGTVPTADSIEYTEPFDMMLGNYVIMAVCINQYTGQSSQITMKIYDLNVGGKITFAEAPGRVMDRLQEIGEVLDGNGTMSGGERCLLLPATVSKIGSVSYYIVKRYRETGAGIKEQGTAYAVDIDTGAVFRAEDNGAGQYNLSGL